MRTYSIVLMVAAGLAGLAATAPANDSEILATASIGDSAEVAIGGYMQSGATNPAVRAYAERLVRDHTKGMHQVAALAKRLHLTMQLPSSDTTARETTHVLEHLRALSGHDRDTAFVNHEIADHEHDIAEAKDLESSAHAPALKKLLKDEMPELREHLAIARKLASSGK